MKTYFTALLFCSVAGGIATVLAGKPYEKHLRFLAALLCTALIVAPIVRASPEIKLEPPSVQGAEPEDCGFVEKQAAEDAEAALAAYIFSETGVKPKEISIEIEREGKQMYLRSVRVRAERKDLETVKGFLDGLFGDELEAEVYE